MFIPIRKTQYMGIMVSAAIHCSVILLFYNLQVGKPVPNVRIIQISLEGQAGPSPDIPVKTEPPLKSKNNWPQNIIHQKAFAKHEPRKQIFPARTFEPVQEGMKKFVSTEKKTVSTGRNEEAAGVANFTQHDATGTGESLGPKKETSGRISETRFGEAGAPAFIHREMPVYPVMARRLGKEGKVVLQLLIDKYGRLQDVEIIEHAGFGFAEAAIKAVKNSTYAPASRNGVNVMAKALLPVSFRLQ